jgi:thiazole biosynthesis/tRNA modification protein ThiI
MEKLILIKYGELTTKKDNRNFFIKTLSQNIKSMLKDYSVNITQNRVRMFIETNDNDLEEIIEKLQKVFGLHSIVVCHKVSLEVEDIKNKSLELIKEEKGKTFKVFTKRSNKNFEIGSMEFNNVIGGHILRNTDLKVDVHNPDISLYIEIRGTNTYIYTSEVKGIGGYPVGIQGKGMLMLSGGIDSPVAGYLTLKRGVTLECLYFESPPHTSVEAKNKVLKLANLMNEYAGNIKVHVVPFTKLQEEIYKKVPHDYMITIMRRMMYRIAERYAKKRKCKILVNGESIGQVASQTLSSISVINDVVNIPVIRPVACMDKIEIIELSKKINTYETSILPFEDCCTVFVPKHPVINPVISKCLEYEENFEFEELIKECISNIETITNLNINKYDEFL